MESLEIRPLYVKHDLEQARHKLATKLAASGKILLIVRGDSPDTENLLARAKELTDCSNWRESIWLREPKIMGSKRESAWFGADPSACAVVLGFDKEPVGCLHSNSTNQEILSLLTMALRRGTRAQKAK